MHNLEAKSAFQKHFVFVESPKENLSQGGAPAGRTPGELVKETQGDTVV